MRKDIQIDKWCGCFDWKHNHIFLKNHDKMNFCIFCGKKLKKEKKH